MTALGISHVRLGEFAWSLYEPAEGKFDFSWLDKAIDVLAGAGLKLIMCTPTATPPSWLIEKYPDVLPYGKDGRALNFGSRCHYSFSSKTYYELSCRITEKIAQKYGRHPAIVAWQTDNEYGNHGTARSYGEVDLTAFIQWLNKKYGTIEKLNQRWGNAFWSMNYTSFSQIPFPHTTAAEANPIHSLDFARFTSEMVMRFNAAQTDILRSYCKNAMLTHNFMGYFTDFDHYELCKNLDLASWDNYPLGFLDVLHSDRADKERYCRTGHPDISAFFHDLYRCCGHGNLWIMEQQPGPVNWAFHNPIPLAGMVRFWTWQAYAHGADLVSFFRWRQLPYAQEQMHAGLLLPDNSEAAAYQEVALLNSETNKLPKLTTSGAEVAILFDYETVWLLDVQPQGRNFKYFDWVFACYQALRISGINVDFVSTTSSLNDYKLILIPSLPIVRETMMKDIRQTKAHFLWGPRSGSKTEDFQIPPNLPPGPLTKFIPLRISQVESLRDEIPIKGQGVFGNFSAHRWREIVQSNLTAQAQCTDGNGIFFSHDNHHYLATLLKSSSLQQLIGHLLMLSGVEKHSMPTDVRRRSCGELDFIFNFGPEPYTLQASPQQLVLGSDKLKQGQCAAIVKK